MKRVITKLIDIATRVVEWDKSHDIYNNGIDNLYPDRVERYIDNSITAKMSSKQMLFNIIGSSFEGVSNIVVHSKTNLKLFDFLSDFASSIVDHKGVFVHVKFNLNYNIKEMKVLPFKSCRIGLKDSNDYNGKIIFSKDWSAKKLETNAIDVFNLNKNVIKAQIEKAGGFEKYKGQIYYYNFERKTVYPTSRIDAVLNDCDSEAQSSIYKNKLLRRGFFGKTIFMTRPLMDKTIPETIIDPKNNNRKIANPEYAQMETEANNFRKNIEGFLGAENADGAIHVEADFDGEKMDEFFKIENIESKINPALFLNVETSLRENILMAYNNLPAGLVKSENSLFSKSAESLKEMKLQYWENNSNDRQIFLREANFLIQNFEGLDGILTVKSVINESN